MTLTAKDILDREFHVRLRGFDMDEVDTFLEEIAETFVKLSEEAKTIQERFKQLEKDNTELLRRNLVLEKTMLTATRQQQAVPSRTANGDKAGLAEIQSRMAGLENTVKKMGNDLRASLASLQADLSCAQHDPGDKDDLPHLYERIELPDPVYPEPEEKVKKQPPQPHSVAYSKPAETFRTAAPLPKNDPLFFPDEFPDEHEPAVTFGTDLIEEPSAKP